MTPAEKPRTGRDILLLLIPAIAALLLFVWLADEVRHGATQHIDDRIRMLVHTWASPALTAAMRGFSLVGTPAVLITLGVVLIMLLAPTERARTLVRFAITIAGAEALDQILKLGFHRTRPATFFGVREPMGYSFPSGHALVSLVFFGALAMLAARTGSRTWRWSCYVAAAVMIGAIGMSRIYLGMHYPSDVLGGYAAGTVWLATVTLARR